MSSDEEYKFNPERKYQGLALVVVNFTKGRYERAGSKNDVKYMKKTFKRLGFKVALFQNLSTREFERLLCKYSQDDVLKDYDSFVFAISTHGAEDKVVDRRNEDIDVRHHTVEMFDRKMFDTEKILDYFSPMKCGALRGKPKLFFIQACRIPSNTATDAHRAKGIGFDCGDSPIKSRKVHDDNIDKADTSDRRDGGDPDRRDGGEPDRRDGGEPDRRDGGEPDRRDGREPDRRDGGEPDRRDGGEPDKRDEEEPARRIFENTDLQEEADDAVSDTDIDEDSDVDEDNDEENDMEDDKVPTEGSDDSNASKERVGSRDVVDATGKERTPVQAPVHITAVPCYNDMLIMFASPQGHYAVRNPDTGSYMLRFLYDSVKTEYGEGRILNNRTNFLYILNDVADKMSSGTYFAGGYKNVTCVVHKLSKDIILSKGEKMQESKFCSILQKIKGVVMGN